VSFGGTTSVGWRLSVHQGDAQDRRLAPCAAALPCPGTVRGGGGAMPLRGQWGVDGEVGGSVMNKLGAVGSSV
jgi:hypothetical protein